ncbi:hypothetical protein KUCAC02_025412 [Chaenocephalus aceratus]|uniref:Uncharacterized protein n=1 Tax=Chaenocephalus aceratus TaxID=36190 RepID=A0ACB9VTW7_CHAAC|nr:hypothetical protein KUCAC02_026850 [Chaenocephalus aceratus]KAI4803764.1 hypothetical protein KUCAC02_025412 [Chaenocephalus aceratus]
MRSLSDHDANPLIILSNKVPSRHHANTPNTSQQGVTLTQVCNVMAGEREGSDDRGEAEEQDHLSPPHRVHTAGQNGATQSHIFPSASSIVPSGKSLQLSTMSGVC